MSEAGAGVGVGLLVGVGDGVGDELGLGVGVGFRKFLNELLPPPHPVRIIPRRISVTANLLFTFASKEGPSGGSFHLEISSPSQHGPLGHVLVD